MPQTPPPFKEGASALTGQMKPLSADPIALLHTLQDQPHDAVAFRLAIIKAVYLSRPGHINTVFKKPKVFVKGGIQLDASRRILGNGLPMSNGDFWARQRRIVADSFRPKAIESYLQVFYRRSQEGRA